MSRVLLVTNDFPPRRGGIQSYLHELVCQLVATGDHQVLVYAPRWKGAEKFDAEARASGYEVVRHPTTLMLPVPTVARRMKRLIKRHRAETVWFGAAAPLALLAPQARAAGARRVIASTHGHEVGWSMLPVARNVLRRIGNTTDVITYVSRYTRNRFASAFGPRAALEHLPPGVDVQRFAPDEVARAELRARYGLDDRPVVVCVSRLVPRKGQDMLIRVWPEVLRAAPGAFLLLVGGGPYRRTLERMIASLGLGGSVLVTGTVPWGRLPAYYDAGDVFAMPCRTRRWGMDVEGLGIVYLEASATGLPVVAGNSGGAPDAVVPGQTGLVVDGRSPGEVADALIGLLKDPAGARAMGERGRAWIEREWRWDAVADRFAALLTGAADLKDAGADP